MGTFQTDFTDSTATGDDFRNTAEQVTGMDFEQFFDQWYYGEGYPIYNFEYYMVGDDFHLVSTQTTSSSITPLFKMIMDYQLHFADGTDTIVSFEQTDNLNHFIAFMGKQVVDVTVDPENWTMEDVESLTVVVDEFSSPAYFSMGPNPATNTLNVFFSEPENTIREIHILDISGKDILITKSSNKHISLDVSRLPKGVYLIKVMVGEKTKVKRFVK
jgi:hypothetical protein